MKDGINRLFLFGEKNMTKRRIIAFLLAFLIIVESFVQCSIPVYASDNVYTGDTWPFKVTKEQWIKNMQSDNPTYCLIFLSRAAPGLLCYLVSQLGAFLTVDFEKWVENNENFANAFDSAWFMIEDEDKLADDDYIKNIKVSAEGMTWLKNAAKQYADEYEPYRIMTTVPITALPYGSFNNQKNVYDTIKNLINDPVSKGSVDVTVDSYYNDENGKKRTVLGVSYYENPTDIAYVATSSGSYIESHGYSWSKWTSQATSKRLVQVVLHEDDAALTSLNDIENLAKKYSKYSSVCVEEKDKFTYFNFPDSGDGYHHATVGNMTPTNFAEVETARYSLSRYDSFKVTATVERYRVYTTVDDFIDATLNRRKIYYTSDWYDKEPGAVTVDLSEVQDSLDGIEKALQELIEQIKNDTGEDDIEKLLQEILDELRNGGGSGGGTGGGESGGGGGVEYDDSSLLSLLSGYFDKVLSYLKQLVDKDYTQTVQDSGGWLEKMNNNLEEMLEQLKAIKRWSAIDAVASSADAVADWISLIDDLLSDVETGADSVVLALSSAFDGAVSAMKVKFPFSLPWDIIAIVNIFSAEPETPVFKLPLHIDSLSYNYDLVVDMEKFSIVSKVSRTFLSVLYALGLIKLSSKFIDIKKGR